MVALFTSLIFSNGEVGENSAEDEAKLPSLKNDDSPSLFMKPILYSTAIVLVVILISIVGFIYNMDQDKDPLIYSKFLTVRKKNN